MPGETVLVAEFSHETNTFAVEPTEIEDFRKRREYVGEEIPLELRGTNSTVGGFIDVADGEAVELVHAVAASAQPGGVVSAEAYDHYQNRIVDAVDEHADELDGVALSLHGAMVPEGMDDGEGPLLTAVREVVGPDVPVVATLDLHGNVTDEMGESADALVAYETYPHVDTGDTGRRAMRLLCRAMRGEIDPVTAIERPPLLPFAATQNTREGPMAEVMAKARELEERDGVVRVNVLPGFHKADVPAMGFSIPVVGDGDVRAARAAARDLAGDVWERREAFRGDYPGPAEAVAEAKDLVAAGRTTDGPIVLADLGDNPGGGNPADGTTILRELLDQGVESAGVAIVRDPDVVDAAIEAGVGERITVTIGGKTDDRHGDPIENLEGYVKAITDGRYANTGPMGTGTSNDLGRTVRFQCGADDDVAVIVTENRVQPLDAEIWRHVGVQPERLDVLVVKSMNHYRADYEPMAGEVLPVNSPGVFRLDDPPIDFENVARPKFPRDEMREDDYPDWD